MRKILVLFTLSLLSIQGSAQDDSAHIDSLEETLNKTNSEDKNMVALLNDIAWEYLYVNPERGLQLSKTAEDLALKLKDSVGLAFAYCNLGAHSEITGDYGTAVSYYHKSLDLYKMLGEWSSYSSVLSNMGILYDQVEYTEKAMEYFQLAVEVDIEHQDFDNLKSNYLNIGQLLKQERQFDLALDYFNKAIQIERDHGEPAYVPRYYLSLGDLFAETEQFDSADVLLREGLKFCKSTGDYSIIGYAYASMANYFRLAHKTDSAAKYCKLAYTRATNTLNQDLLLTVLSIKSEVERQQGDFRTAVSTSERFMNMRDSLFNLKKTFQLSVLETEYGLERTERELEALAIQNKAKENYILLISILGSVIVLVSAIFFILNRSKNRKLQERNQKIEQSLEEIQLLAKESHHRIKNNLQVISSLLKLQAKHVRSESARGSLNEAFHRIRTISLIHQKLYKTESFTTVNLRDFLHQLANQLRQSYGKEEDLIVEVQGIDIDLKVDNAIYVGLIVNELVTNCIKYGLGKKNEKSRVVLSFNKAEKGLVLTVQDNGSGFKNPNDVLTQLTFGFKVMNSLLRSFKGEIEAKNNNGALVTVFFKSIEYYEHAVEISDS